MLGTTPHLTSEQLQARGDVCMNRKKIMRKDSSFWSHVITSDETWAYIYDHFY